MPERIKLTPLESVSRVNIPLDGPRYIVVTGNGHFGEEVDWSTARIQHAWLTRNVASGIFLSPVTVRQV